MDCRWGDDWVGGWIGVTEGVGPKGVWRGQWGSGGTLGVGIFSRNSRIFIAIFFVKGPRHTESSSHTSIPIPRSIHIELYGSLFQVPGYQYQDHAYLWF